MFILRRITSKGLELNTCLGIEYVLVLKEVNESEFRDRVKLWGEEDLKDLYGVVCFDDGGSIMPLYKKSSYYIMTGDGKTFSNISEK
jgi:hypothetical protein